MSSARTRPRFLTVLVTVGLIAGFVLAAPAPTVEAAIGPDFSIQASINHGEGDYIEGSDFSPNETATVTVFEAFDDGNDVGVGIVYGPVTHGTDENGWFFFNPGRDLVPGNYIVAIDDATGSARQLELEPLTVTSINPDTDVVSGTGKAGSDLFVVGPSDCDGEKSVINLIVPPDGDWLADFGTPDWGQVGFTNAEDLGAVHLFDGDGDNTLVSSPSQLYVTANVSNASVSVQFSNPDDALTIPFDGVREARVDVINHAEGDATDRFGPVPSAPYEGVQFDTGLVFEEFMEIVAYDDTLGFQTAIDIVPLSFHTLDPDTETASGIAPADAQVDVQLHNGEWAQATADSSGNWSATFVDVPPDVGGSVFLRECDGDSLQADFFPEPLRQIEVFPDFEQILAWWSDAGWWLTIERPGAETNPVFEGYEPGPAYGFDLWAHDPPFDVMRGDTVTMSDGETIKVHTVVDITVDPLTPGATEATGTGPANTTLFINLMEWPEHEGGGLGSLVELVDENGDWLADFGVPFRPGLAVEAVAIEPDTADGNDQTHVLQYIPEGPVGGPWIAVHYDNAHPGEYYGRVAANDWPGGVDLTLTVERWNKSLEPPAFAQVYSETATSGPEYPFAQRHDEPNPFFVERGDRVTVTDGPTTKVHDVYNLIVDGIDYDADVVSGTTDATDREVCVDLWSEPGQPRLCTTDFGLNGEWSVDFDFPAGEGITPQSDLAAWQYDDQGDATTMNNYLLQGQPPAGPNVQAYITEEFIRGDEFAYPSTLQVDLYDPSGELVNGWEIQTEDGFFFIEMHETEFHLEPGMEIVVFDGETEKRLRLVEARFDDFDADPNSLDYGVVRGYAPDLPIGEARLHLFDQDYQPMWNDEQQPIKLFPDPDFDGDFWSYDIDDDDPAYHPTGLTEARIEVPDDDGDATFASLTLITVIPLNTIQSYSFDGESAVEVVILDDGVLIPENPINVAVDERGEFGVATEEYGVNLDPGDEVWVTGIDNGVLKHHVVRELIVDFDGIDYDNDVVRGVTGEPFAWVEIATSVGPMRGQADDGGNWEATFTEGGDLQPGMHVAAWTADPDMDRTFVEPAEQQGPPEFSVHVNQDSVEGFNWPDGALIHLEIVNGEDLNNEDPDLLFGMNVWVGDNQVGSEGNVGFWFAGDFDVQPGHGVIMTDGETTERHIVQPIEVTEVDAENDVVRGVANPDDEIWVFAENATRLVTAGPEGGGELGAWTADFSDLETEHDQGFADLLPGVEGGAAESDPVNGNVTEFIWRIADPVFVVYPDFSSVGGHDWTEGAEAVVTIDDPDTSESPDVTLSAMVERFEPWEQPGFDVGIDGEEFTIEPRHIVTVSDGTTTKTHVVTALQVTAADVEANTVSGLAESGSEVVVFVHGDQGGIERETTALANGSWTVDFNETGPDEEPFELEYGMAVEALQPDDDGDATAAPWQLRAPRLTADQFDDIVQLDWPEAGVEFDIRISSLGDGSTWTGTATTGQVGGEGPWEIGLFFDLYFEGRDVVMNSLIELLEPGTENVVRELLVSPLTVTQLDPSDAGTVHGVATADSTLQLSIENSTGWAWHVVEVDDAGDWTAYPGHDPSDHDEEGDGVVGDVGSRYEVGFNLEEPDLDGDATVVRWGGYRMGAVSVLSNRDVVVGERWTGLWPATVTIENQTGMEVYTRSGIPIDRGPSALELDGEPLFWDSPEWENHFSLRVAGLVEPGHTVTISDGLYTESTVVSAVAVTEVDLAADVIRGGAGPNELVLVFTESIEPGDPFFSSVRFTCSDETGTWEVGFGEPLVGPLDLPCLPDGAQPALGEGEEIPAFDLDFDSVVRGFASTTDSENPFGNEPDDDDGTLVTWWTHLTELEATPSPAEVDVDEVTFTATIAGTDSDEPWRDAVAATVDWDDETTTPISTLPVPGPQGDIALTATHTYAAVGVYTVVLTVEYRDGHIEIEAYRYVVVTEVGFITGGGWIESPAGAYTADPQLTGKANFGFVAKYKKGRSVPDGNTNFQFQAAGLHFQSTSYDWLVVTGGDHAKFKGEGTINGAGEYGFMVTAVDDPEGDTFRIKIWVASTEEVVYDNKPAVADDGYDGTALGGGSIVVHDGK